ncbi:MAG TPA: hypothetical protein VFU81_06595, partial [Thermomicrobiales bacterium]|nr:hypothetical protein [Thermomicrobiales bacterium]
RAAPNINASLLETAAARLAGAGGRITGVGQPHHQQAAGQSNDTPPGSRGVHKSSGDRVEVNRIHATPPEWVADSAPRAFINWSRSIHPSSPRLRACGRAN